MGKNKKKRAPEARAETGQGKKHELPKIYPKSARMTPVHGNEIFTVKNALSDKECQALVEYAESVGFEHQGSRGAAFQEAVRDNDRISFHDANFAEALWHGTGLHDLFASISVDSMHAVGLNPHIRFYRYSKGQRFGKHIDESVALDDAKTHYTLLIYLSGEEATGQSRGEKLVGGETVFYGRKNKVIACIKPEVGTALLHIHGDHCHEHEGAQVLPPPDIIPKAKFRFLALIKIQRGRLEVPNAARDLEAS